jgi:hypothetical protein
MLELSNNDSNSLKGKDKVDDITINTTVKKVTFANQGMGEYRFENALCVGQLPLSPHSFGKPSQIPPSTNKDTMHANKTTFEHWGSLSDENMESNILDWLYFDEKDDPCEFPKDKYVKSSPIIENMGYCGTGLRPKEDRIRKPLEANSYPKGCGLGSIKPKVSFVGTIVWLKLIQTLKRRNSSKCPSNTLRMT